MPRTSAPLQAAAADPRPHISAAGAWGCVLQQQRQAPAQDTHIMHTQLDRSLCIPRWASGAHSFLLRAHTQQARPGGLAA